MLAWIAFSMLATAGLGVAAWFAESAISRRYLPRRTIWFAVMVASVALPIGASVSARTSSVSSPAGPTSPTEAAPASVSSPPSGSNRVDQVVIIGWALASIAIACWLFAIHVALQLRLRRCARTFMAGATPIVSPNFGPAVVGLFRPVIVLPEWSLSLNPADRALVLTHELEHTRAHDPALNFAGLALVVLFPWNLALWWQLSRLSLAIEVDCDRRVIRDHSQDRARYGQLLLDARALSSMTAQGGLALTQHRSAVGRRIEALMTNGGLPASRVLGSGLVCAGLIAAVAFAPSPPLPHVSLSSRPTPVAPSPAAAPTITPIVRPVGVIRKTAPPTHRVKSAKPGIVVAGPLPGLQMTRTGVVAELTHFTLPTPPRVPISSMRGGAIMIGRPGGGGAGGIVARGAGGAQAGRLVPTGPSSGVVRVVKPDSVSTGVLRPIRPDTTTPPNR